MVFLKLFYQRSFEIELISKGYEVTREAGTAVFYKGRRVGIRKVDLLINDFPVVEIKAVSELANCLLAPGIELFRNIQFRNKTAYQLWFP